MATPEVNLTVVPPQEISVDQRNTLGSTYTFLRQATEYLEAVLPIVCAEDETHVQNLLNLGKLAASKLVQSFPEVAEWERQR